MVSTKLPAYHLRRKVLKKARGNLFFDCFEYWSKSSTNKFRTIIIKDFVGSLFLKTMLNLGKYSNWKCWLRADFQLEYFPRSNIMFESRFLRKSYIITILNLFGVFQSVFKKKYIYIFPFVFSNLARPMVRSNFRDTIWVI